MAAAGIMGFQPYGLYDPRKEDLAPTHNAITLLMKWWRPVYCSHGNRHINDLHKPFTDGDMWTELRLMLEACRFFDLEALAILLR